MAYKPNVDDPRESPSVEIMQKLKDSVIQEVIGRRIAGNSLRKIESDMGLSRATVSKYWKGIRDNNEVWC